MDFPDFFADAEASFNESDLVIFGIPYDKTSSFRPGAIDGPKEIRRASWNFETFNMQTGVDIKDFKFHDYGDLDVKSEKPDIMVKKVRDFTGRFIDENKFPIVLGGEHSITPGVVQGFLEDVAVLSLDAHMDFRQEYENERNNHACVMRRISDHVPIENIAVLGVRSAEKQEYYDAKKQGLFFVDSHMIRDYGIKKVLEKTKERIGGKKIYLTLDIDVLDPSYAPGTSTPEPFGLSPIDIVECIDCFSEDIVGFDVVEVCPPFDNGETSLISAKFVRYMIEKFFSKI